MNATVTCSGFFANSAVMSVSAATLNEQSNRWPAFAALTASPALHEASGSPRNGTSAVGVRIGYCRKPPKIAPSLDDGRHGQLRAGLHAHRARRIRASLERRGLAVSRDQHLSAWRRVVDADHRLLAGLHRHRLDPLRAVVGRERDRQRRVLIRELEPIRRVAEVLTARQLDRELEARDRRADDLQRGLFIAVVDDGLGVPARGRIVEMDGHERLGARRAWLPT